MRVISKTTLANREHDARERARLAQADEAATICSACLEPLQPEDGA